MQISEVQRPKTKGKGNSAQHYKIDVPQWSSAISQIQAEMKHLNREKQKMKHFMDDIRYKNIF